MQEIRTRNLPNTDWFDAVFPINIVHDYMYQLTKFHDQIMIQKMNSKLYLTQLPKLMKWFEILKAEYLTNETYMTVQWNGKILKLCLKDYIFTIYHFLAEVIFNSRHPSIAFYIWFV